MPWWGWLLVGALSTGVLVLIIILLIRKPTIIRGLTEEELEKLASVEREKAAREIEAEQAKVTQLEAIAKAQQERLAKLEEVYNNAKQTINAEKREEFERYLGDAAAAGAELDKLLGLSADDPTPVVIPRRETGTSGEG